MVHASEAVGVERRCSRAVQLKMDVLGAAEHAAEAWEAAMSAYQRASLLDFSMPCRLLICCKLAATMTVVVATVTPSTVLSQS